MQIILNLNYRHQLKNLFTNAKEYILSLRHEKAKEYLKYSDLSISAISEKLGFSSVQYFVSFFQKREGYTPLIFRKNMIINQNMSENYKN